MAAAVGIVLLYLVWWRCTQLLFGWQAIASMNFHAVEAVILARRNEDQIFRYYTNLLTTDPIKKYVVTGEIGLLTDIRINTDVSNKVTDTDGRKIEVVVSGDFGFSSYNRTVSVTLEFNDDNSQLTTSKYEISAITDHNPIKQLELS